MFWRHDTGKKNGWPIGHPDAGQRSAILYTRIVRCHGKDPMAYLKDILPRLPLTPNLVGNQCDGRIGNHCDRRIGNHQDLAWVTSAGRLRTSVGAAERP
jgi:hypothetical protein